MNVIEKIQLSEGIDKRRDDVCLVRDGVRIINLPYVDFNLDSAYWHIAGLQQTPAVNAFGSPETKVFNLFCLRSCGAVDGSVEKQNQSNQYKGCPWKTSG